MAEPGTRDVEGVLLWAASGAMALTGPADGPPALSPGAPALAVADALAVLGAPDLPGVGVLGERAALAGFTRRAPLSVGGAFRAIPAADGWFGISLARTADLDLVPALVEGGTSAGPWEAIAEWASRLPVDAAVERARLLGLAACAVASTPPAPEREPVVVTPGGARVPRERPLVVDLTSLWAGPLCAHLLGLGGARVVKVESLTRPDGARRGPAAFFDLLHAGHESVAVDFARPAELAALLDAADVVLEASRPRALQQLGIEAGDYVARGTVWASITGYGRAGPAATWAGFGDDVAAAAGLVAWSDGVPYPVGDAIADPLAGVTAAAAVAATLRGATGALIDVSMYDVALQAARLPAPDGVHVEQHHSGAWEVRVSGRSQSVQEPLAREPAGSAPALGAHTRAVLDELGGALSDR